MSQEILIKSVNFPQLNEIKINKDKGKYFIVIKNIAYQFDSQKDAFEHMLKNNKLCFIFDLEMILNDKPYLLFALITRTFSSLILKCHLKSFKLTNNMVESNLYLNQEFIIDTGATKSSISIKKNYDFDYLPEKIIVETGNGKVEHKTGFFTFIIDNKEIPSSCTMNDTDISAIGLDVLANFVITLDCQNGGLMVKLT